MKQLSKKFLALLLAFVLVMGLLPGAAFAGEALPDYTGDWTSFRGNPENNGVTDAKTPITTESASLKWAQKYGSGWFAAPTPPLILNGDLYIAVSNQVLKIDRDTGEKLAESPAMGGNVGFAMNPIAYGGGRIYVPLSAGQIQALRADTLELLWVSEKMTGVSQTNSPVVYHDGFVYTGIWGGEEKNGSYFCLDAETGEKVWAKEQMGGFYWAGAYVTDKYLVVGSGDSTPENSYTETAVLFSLNPKTGEVIDTIENIKGDIRSSVCYDDGKVYFATKGGWFCTAAVDENGAFDQESFQYVDLKGMCTGTPMVYNDRAYIGSSGAQQFNGPGYLNVIDLSGGTPELAYRAELPGYPQASALATSAYGDTAYVYITYNQRPGGIYAIKDEPGQTEAVGENIYTPASAQQNYGICSLVCDADGTLYYKNDSCYLMAVERNAAYAETLTLDRTDLTLSSGTSKLTATVDKTLGDGPVEMLVWSSSDERVVTVAQDGTVTCVGGGRAVITVSGALTSASCNVTSTAPMEVTVSAYDYTAKAAGLTGASATGVIMEQVVEVPSDSTAAEAVEAAFTEAGVDIVGAHTNYVTSINGLAAGTGGGYSGWCLSYNEDDFGNLGLGSLSLSSGDRLSFHYSVNPDMSTDDIGNGWYGLPIVTSLTLAGQPVTMSKETTYGPDFSSQTDYYIHSQQGSKVKLQGAGTSGDPFQIPMTLPYSTNLTNLTAAYTTSLNEHYRVVEGLDGPQNYTNGLSFSLSSLGGHYKTYYKISATVQSGGDTPAPSDNISVSFRLIGSTRSGGDVDLGAGGYEGAQYQTWLKTKTYTLPKNATVYDLFTTALDEGGLRYTGAENNYVDTIYAPGLLGGYQLSEFTNGSRSGWMYTVNGTHPGVGLKDRTLRQGDKVVWHYVNDYSYEVSDWFDDADYPSLGDGTYYNAWLKAADTNPTASSGGSPSPEKPSTGLTPSATTDKNGEARAEVSTKDVESAIADAKKNGADGIVIEPTVKGSASKVSVELPKDAVAAIARDTAAKLTVKTAIAAISLPAGALGELGQSEGKTVAISAETVMDESGKATGEIRVEVAAAGKAVDSVKGGLTVALPVSKATPGTVLMLVTDEGARIIRKSAADGGTLTALLGGSATVVVKDNTQTFADVGERYWGRDAVNFAASHELFQGAGTGTFAPDGNMSRAMLFTVLGRLEEQDATAGSTWYEGSMLWAKAQGISDGTNPDGSISREQLATMLYRYAEVAGADTSVGGNAVREFGDADKVSAWAVDAMAWAVGSGLISGKGGDMLDPAGTATRGEVAAMLQRLIPMLLK